MPSSKQINSEIFKIAIPNILGNISIALLGFVDTFLMGHEENGELLLGAIGLASIVFNLLYWNFGFIRVATTGITAQAYGEQAKDKQAHTFFRAVLLGLLIAILILILSQPIANFGFSIIKNKVNAEAIQPAMQYFSIRILAVPAVMILYGFRGWFYGMQNAIYPFVLTLLVNVVNIIASIYFVQVLDFSIAGVAWGTVVAQYVCLVTAFFLFSKYRWVFSYLKWKELMVPAQLKRFFSVSGFVFGRNVMLSIVFSAFTYFSSLVSQNYLAANQVLLQFFYMMSFAVDGFAYASEALVGKYIGAKQKSDVKKVVKLTMSWGVGLGVLYAIGYQLFGVQIFQLFTVDDSILEVGAPYIIWLSIIAIAGSFAFIWDGVFIGATYVKEMFFSMTIALITFFGMFFLTKNSLPKDAVWISMTAYMLVRGVVQWFLYSRKPL